MYYKLNIPGLFKYALLDYYIAMLNNTSVSITLQTEHVFVCCCLNPK